MFTSTLIACYAAGTLAATEPPPAVAAAGSTGNRLSLEAAIGRALKNHPSFQVLQAEIEVAEGAALTAAARPNPDLTLGPGLKRASPDGARFHGEAEISQVLEFPGKRALRVSLAEGDARLRKLALEGFGLQLRIEVSRAYYRVSAARRIAGLRADQVQSARAFLQAAEKRVAGGYASDFESMKAQADWIEARRELAEAQAQARSAKLALAGLMGAPSDTAFATDESIDSTAFAPISSEAIAAALERNPAIRAEALRAELAEKGVSAARIANRPDLTVAPGLEYTREEQVYGMNLSMPLPLWNRGQGEIRAAEAESRRARAESARLRQEIAAGVLAAQEKARAAGEQLALYTPEFLAGVKDIMLRAEKVYGQSSTSLLIYLEARRTHFESLTGYNRALAEWAESHLELEAALGAPLANGKTKDGGR